MSAPGHKVSIGLPVYNGEDHLKACLNSLLNQIFDDFELIIVDNASTDRTPAICQAYADRDSRITYYRQEQNVGAAANFNRAFALSTGEYFKWAAHDDICAPDFLDVCVSVLDNDDSLVLAFTGTELINDDDTYVKFDPEQNAFVDSGGRSWIIYFETELFADDPVARFQAILLRSILCHEVFGLIRSSALKRTSLIGDYYGSDKVLLAELCLQGRFHQVPHSLFYRRCHPRQSSKQPLIEKEKWISGKEPGRIVFPQKFVLQGYLHALSHFGRTPGVKMRGYYKILRYVLRPEKLKRLNVTQKDSYVRINAGRKERTLTVDTD